MCVPLLWVAYRPYEFQTVYSCKICARSMLTNTICLCAAMYGYHQRSSTLIHSHVSRRRCRLSSRGREVLVLAIVSLLTHPSAITAQVISFTGATAFISEYCKTFSLLLLNPKFIQGMPVYFCNKLDSMYMILTINLVNVVKTFLRFHRCSCSTPRGGGVEMAESR